MGTEGYLEYSKRRKRGVDTNSTFVCVFADSILLFLLLVFLRKSSLLSTQNVDQIGCYYCLLVLGALRFFYHFNTLLFCWSPSFDFVVLHLSVVVTDTPVVLVFSVPTSGWFTLPFLNSL